MLRRLVLLLPATLLRAAPARGQTTSDGPAGRNGTGAASGMGAVRPVPDPSAPCRHGADGLPGGAPGCPAGRTQPVLPTDPPGPPPFTGGVFGPDGRGPDKRPQPRASSR